MQMWKWEKKFPANRWEILENNNQCPVCSIQSCEDMDTVSVWARSNEYGIYSNTHYNGHNQDMSPLGNHALPYIQWMMYVCRASSSIFLLWSLHIKRIYSIYWKRLQSCQEYFENVLVSSQSKFHIPPRCSKNFENIISLRFSDSAIMISWN